MSKNSNNLEKRFIKNAFKNLNRKLVCPHNDCNYLGTHFRCYDLSYEDCDIYIRWKQQFQRENNLEI